MDFSLKAGVEISYDNWNKWQDDDESDGNSTHFDDDVWDAQAVPIIKTKKGIDYKLGLTVYLSGDVNQIR